MATGELKTYILNTGDDHTAKRCPVCIKLTVIPQTVDNLMIFLCYYYRYIDENFIWLPVIV
jgi:hypothetical protein